MTDRSEWQGTTGETWAAEWRRTDRSFTQLTERLLGRIGAFGFTQALDVGCGAGELALAMARANPAARVVGVDISPRLVETAGQRGAAEGLVNVDFVLADAASWQPAETYAPELIVSRHGVMFFDDAPAAFANLARTAAPGAALVFSCFRQVAENPFVYAVTELLPLSDGPPPDPHAPGPFAFADPQRVARILEAGGWTDIGFEAVDFPIIAGVGEDATGEAMAYFSAIGPAARAARTLDGEARAQFLARLRAMVEAYASDGKVALGAAAWIVTARRGSVGAPRQTA